MSGACSTYGGEVRLYRVLVEKPEGRRWEYNIKMDLQGVERGCGDRMELAQVRERRRALVSKVMNFRVP